MTKTRISKFEPLDQPREWQLSYNDKDKAAVIRVIDWLNAENQNVADPRMIKTQAWLARLAAINDSAANQVLKGKYPSSPTNYLAKLTAAIDEYERKQLSNGADSGFVETSIYKTVKNVCARARTMCSFGLVAGYVGVGKTAAAKAYVIQNPNTYLLEATPSMSVGVMLDALMTLLKIGVSARYGSSRTQDARFSSIVDAVKGTSILLIIDEAEFMTPKCLHYLRRIRDKGDIGMVLMGTEGLNKLIAPEHGEFDQIRSRVCLWPPTMTSINRDDADALTRNMLGDVDDDVLETFWKYCKGSARMLTENLIPSVRDFGVKKDKELNADLVHAVAKQVLNLKPV